MKLYRQCAVGLGAAALLMSAATAASASTATKQGPSLSVSPGKVKPGASVIVNATCAGKITSKPTSGALASVQQLPTVAAPNHAWKATVGKKVKAGSYAVNFKCNGKTYKSHVQVQGAATPTVKKVPKKAVRTGAGGTADLVAEAGSGTPAAAGAALQVPPRIATTFLLDLRW